MHHLPTLEYENYDLKRATISRYSLVKCEGNFYSVPDTYRPRQITLKIMVDMFNRYYLDDPKGFLPILDLMHETSPEALSSALTILNKQNISPTYDTLRFFLHQTIGTKS
jgi:hypothetical protein